MGNLIPLPDWPWPIVKIPEDNLFNATATNCDTEISRRHLAEVTVLSVAAGLIVLLNLVKVIAARKLEFLIPIDLLNCSPFRIIYCIIMTLWAADVFQDLFSHDRHYHSPDPVVDAAKFFGLTPTVIFLRQALIYFPVLASVDFAVPSVGHYIGFFYTLLMGAYQVFSESVVVRGCSHRGQLDNLHIAISLCVKLPVFIGYVLVAGWFFFHAAMETALVLFTKLSPTSKIQEYKAGSHYEEHVRELLKKPVHVSIFNIKKNVPGFAYLGLNYVLPSSPTFKYPLSFMAPLSMGWMVLYQLCLQLMTTEVVFSNNLIEFVESFNITVAELSNLFPSKKLLFENIYYDVRSFAEAMLIILPFGTAIALGLAGFFTMYLVQFFHKRLMRAAEGNIAFLVGSEPLPSKAYILAAFMKYVAFQTGYLIFAWCVYTFMECSLMIFGLGFYYMFKNTPFMAVRLWSIVMVPMMWGALLHHFQLFICRYFFLKNTEGDFIYIRFKNLYQLLSYILLFFNMMFAWIMCFLRIFTIFMFSVVMLFRIDWDIYMRGLEGWDFGHRTYVGYMYLEYTHNNAVVRTFVQTLVDTVRERRNLRANSRETTPKRCIQNKLDRSLSMSPEPSEKVSLLTNGKATVISSLTRRRGDCSVRSRRARNLWQVAYTLTRNPQLISLTASQLRADNHYGSEHKSLEDSKTFL